MNTMRGISLHWPGSLGEPAAVNRRRWIVFALVCLVVFACSFAIGHATNSRSALPAPGTSSFSVAYAGTAVPDALSSAPPIETIAAVRSNRPASAGSAGSRSGKSGSTAPSSPAPTLVAQPPTNVAPTFPTPIATPSPAVKAPSSHTQHHSGGGVSFDSSG